MAMISFAYRDPNSKISLSQIRHMLGGFFVGVEYGFVLKLIEVNKFISDGKYACNSEMICKTSESDDDKRKRLSAQIQMIYAGVLAQALSEKQPWKINEEEARSFLKSNGASDYSKAEKLILQLSSLNDGNCNTTDQPKKICEEHWDKAKSIIIQKAPLINEMSKRMLSDTLPRMQYYSWGSDELEKIIKSCGEVPKPNSDQGEK